MLTRVATLSREAIGLVSSIIPLTHFYSGPHYGHVKKQGETSLIIADSHRETRVE